MNSADKIHRTGTGGLIGATRVPSISEASHTSHQSNAPLLPGADGGPPKRQPEGRSSCGQPNEASNPWPTPFGGAGGWHQIAHCSRPTPVQPPLKRPHGSQVRSGRHELGCQSRPLCANRGSSAGHPFSSTWTPRAMAPPVRPRLGITRGGGGRNGSPGSTA